MVVSDTLRLKRVLGVGPTIFRQRNIPVEILRTVVAIAETGSLSKAAAQLRLSQPAVSSQVKRLQTMLGGRLFLKTANGTSMTELGKLVLQQARRILEANDQLFCLGVNHVGPRPLRLGLSSLYLEDFLAHQTTETLSNVFIHVDHSTSISQGLMEGYIDIACIFENRSIEPDVSHGRAETRGADGVGAGARLRPQPRCADSDSHLALRRLPIRALSEQWLAYRIVLNCSGFHSKMAAAKAGIGLTVVPQSLVPADLVRAQEYYLPPLPPIQRLLCVRPHVETDQAARLTQQLSAIFFNDVAPAAIAERAGKPSPAIRIPKAARV